MRRYIDAERVAEELSKVPWYNRDDERQAVRIVREFSTADVQEVRQGRWIDLKCDQCGQVDMSKPNYCPNCGARMEEENDEEAINED